MTIELNIPDDPAVRVRHSIIINILKRFIRHDLNTDQVVAELDQLFESEKKLPGCDDPVNLATSQNVKR